MIQAMHPHIDLADSIVRIFGIPGILAGLVWLVRTYDKGARELRDVHADVAETRRMALETHGGIAEIKNNHLAHLQTGIESVAKSNDEAVTVLHDIKTGISVLTDRFPRA